ncbi:MAG: hypothetical protein ACRD6B_00885, partial [Bryobacteraceae bacterium]
VQLACEDPVTGCGQEADSGDGAFMLPAMPPQARDALAGNAAGGAAQRASRLRLAWMPTWGR